MDGQTPNLHIFRCVTSLRGYHVYQLNFLQIIYLRKLHVFTNVLRLNRVNFMYLEMFSPSLALISYNKVALNIDSINIIRTYQISNVVLSLFSLLCIFFCIFYFFC